MKTIVVNLLGGPCCGKSTLAAGIFHYLKTQNIDCELAGEVAKDKVWSESYTDLQDQIFIFGCQYHRIWRLNGKVQVCIADSPLLLVPLYSKVKSKYFKDLVIEQYKQFNNVNYFIERNTDFNENGRIHTLEDSIKLDRQIENLMHEYNVSYTTVKNTEALKHICDDIMQMLKNE